MAFCGLFTRLVEEDSSSNTTEINGTPIRTNLGSKYSSGLSSYRSACKQDPNLKAFDSLLHQRTNKVIKSLADQAETQSISPDSLMEVYGFLLELDLQAVELIVESKEDVWENKELQSLVDSYFESTAKTLDFFTTVQFCVRKTEISQLIIRFAVKQFETESLDNNNNLGGNKKKKYAKTLEELNKFHALGDPFGDEFLAQYLSVYEQQVLLLEDLGKLTVKLDKTLRNIKIWRKLVNVVFASVLVSVLVLSVVLTATTAPPVLIAVASALTAPIDIVGKWCRDMWKVYEKAVKKQKRLAKSTEKYTRVNKEATKTIQILVENLRTRISSILKTVEFAVEREEDEAATMFAMQEIKKKVEEFTEKIKEVGDNADKYIKLIASGRLRVLEHVVNLPANTLTQK